MLGQLLLAAIILLGQLIGRPSGKIALGRLIKLRRPQFKNWCSSLHTLSEMYKRVHHPTGKRCSYLSIFARHGTYRAHRFEFAGKWFEMSCLHLDFFLTGEFSATITVSPRYDNSVEVAAVWVRSHATLPAQRPIKIKICLIDFTLYVIELQGSRPHPETVVSRYK